MKIALIMGGRSGEHDVSLRSGEQVAAALTALGYDHLRVVLQREGGARWRGAGADGTGSVAAALAAMADWSPDAAFIAMHGSDGEDGRVQGALELLGIPYQGSGVQASANGLDKAQTKTLYRAAGLPVAEDSVVVAGQTVDWNRIARDLGLPLVLKTEASGSSVGIEIVDAPEALAVRGAALLAQTPLLLIEQYVAGREFTAAVLESEAGVPEALPIVEIRPRDAAFFDYEAKYTPGATDEICPADIPPVLEAQLRALGLAAHAALRCAGYSRTDIIVSEGAGPVLLETNTLPGMTAESLLPKAATAAGLSFEALIDRLIARAIARH